MEIMLITVFDLEIRYFCKNVKPFIVQIFIIVSLIYRCTVICPAGKKVKQES